MILSNVSIHEALDKKWLVIDPEPLPRFKQLGSAKCPYARCGLLVHFTAPTIHAGYDATITLELINLGTIPIILAPNAPICQLIVEQLHGFPFDNPSQFQGQVRAGGMKS